MKFILIISFLFLIFSCSKPKSVFICGDHICINKDEAKQYFEENLALEVKVLEKNKKKEVDLVEINLRENKNGNKMISVLQKNETNKKLKTLSESEIINIKNDIKKKDKEKKFAKKNIKSKKKIKNINQIKLDESKVNNKDRKFDLKSKKFKNNENDNRQIVLDVCKILDKCTIDEISKYLLDEANKKKFPDITLRQ